MKIKWNKTKYMLPVVILPFLFLLNYGYQSLSNQEEVEEQEAEPGIRSIGDVSKEVQNKGLAGKLEAFRERYNRATDGQTPIKNLEVEMDDAMDRDYHLEEKLLLDSIDKVLQFENKPAPSPSFSAPPIQVRDYNRPASISDTDVDLEDIHDPTLFKDAPSSKYDDPMVLFREQMKVIDSISKASDPGYQQDLDSSENLAVNPPVVERKVVPVKKATGKKDLFNTIKVEEEKSFIKAIVDEELKKGAMGERIAIRILDDIEVGGNLIPKDSRIYAQVAGFQNQRVKIAITTIMVEDKILPVDLSVFDLDGLEGLYVPDSKFREFSKELGSNSTGGMNLRMQQDPSSFNQLYMSSIQRMFTSTSQAVSKALKQNRATLKYGTIIYLVDPEDLNP
jgi:hypothetical protein